MRNGLPEINISAASTLQHLVVRMNLLIPAHWIFQPFALRKSHHRFNLRADVGFADAAIQIRHEYDGGNLRFTLGHLSPAARYGKGRCARAPCGPWLQIVRYCRGEQTPNIYFAWMPVRSCRVTIQDMDGVFHTVEVTAFLTRSSREG